jgi:hypothetical protein
MVPSTSTVSPCFIRFRNMRLPFSHIHATPIPHDRGRGYLPHSGRYLTRTREGSSRLCDRWRSHIPPANPWVEALTPCPRASPIPLQASARGMVERPCLIHGLEKRGGDGRARGDLGAEASVTKIVDRGQAAVREIIGGIARFSRRERAVVRRHPSRGAGKPLAGTSDGAPTPCRVFQLQKPCSFWNSRSCSTPRQRRH